MKFKFENFMEEYYNNSIGIYFDNINCIDPNIIERMIYSHKMSYVFFISPKKQNKKNTWKKSNNIKYLNVKEISLEDIINRLEDEGNEYMVYIKKGKSIEKNKIEGKNIIFSMFS